MLKKKKNKCQWDKNIPVYFLFLYKIIIVFITHTHTHTHTYIHTHIHTYIHTYMHAYIHRFLNQDAFKEENYLDIVFWTIYHKSLCLTRRMGIKRWDKKHNL